MIRKSHALDFPSYIFILSSSFYDYCSVGTSTSFVRYLRVPWCLEVALDFTYNHQACLSLHWNLFIWWLLPSTLFIPLGLMPFSSLWGVTSRLIKRVKIILSHVIVLSLLLFNFKNYGYLVGLAHIFYSCIPCLSFHLSLESQLDLVQITATPHTPFRTTLIIIFLSSSPFINIG